MDQLTLFFDGSCVPNPGGVATYGWLIVEPNEGALDWISDECGVVTGCAETTNNLAEWCALFRGLKQLDNEKWRGELTIHGDSDLVVKQLTGEWKCKKTSLRECLDACLAVLERLGPWAASWIPREENAYCDALARRAYERHTGLKYPENISAAQRRLPFRGMNQAGSLDDAVMRVVARDDAKEIS